MKPAVRHYIICPSLDSTCLSSFFGDVLQKLAIEEEWGSALKCETRPSPLATVKPRCWRQQPASRSMKQQSFSQLPSITSTKKTQNKAPHPPSRHFRSVTFLCEPLTKTGPQLELPCQIAVCCFVQVHSRDLAKLRHTAGLMEELKHRRRFFCGELLPTCFFWWTPTPKGWRYERYWKMKLLMIYDDLWSQMQLIHIL